MAYSLLVELTVINRTYLRRETDLSRVCDQIDWKEMKHGLVSQHDLEKDLHLDAKTEDISEIETARLERSGDISFIKKKR